MAAIDQAALRAARHAARRLVEASEIGEHPDAPLPPAVRERARETRLVDALVVAEELDRLADLKADLRLALTERMVEGHFVSAMSKDVDWLVRKIAMDLGLV